MKQEQTKETQNQKERTTHIGKGRIGNGVTKGIGSKGSKQYQILIGQDHQYAQKETNRKGCGEAFEYKGSEYAECQMDNARPN